jgi:hypothetical protein
MLVLGTPELVYEVLHAPPGAYLVGAAKRRILPVLPENTLLRSTERHTANGAGSWPPCPTATRARR